MSKAEYISSRAQVLNDEAKRLGFFIPFSVSAQQAAEEWEAFERGFAALAR